MPRTITCARCGRQAAALETPPPLPAALADEVLARVCVDCWTEWQKNEVMVINELRLNFMDPRSAEVLHQKLREFMNLAPGASG